MNNLRSQRKFITTDNKNSRIYKIMSFSWKQDKKDAIEMKIRNAIAMADSATNPTFKLEHPDWVRDAQKKDYTLLKKQVKDLTEKNQKRAMDRRIKRGDSHSDL